MKDFEFRLIAELMKNSRRSDRELANALCKSQPTVSRTIKKLEKEGIIKEYTMVPDFSKLGYAIMGITSLKVADKPKLGVKELRDATAEAEKSNPHAGLMIVNGTGNNKNGLFIDFYEDYSEYVKTITVLRQLPFIDVESIDSFLVDLGDETNYRLLGTSKIAEHIMKRAGRNHNSVRALLKPTSKLGAK